MTHRMPTRAPLGKRLLATSSVLALVAGVGSAAHAANVTNPASIPNPTVAAGQMATSIVFNDGKTHTGSIVNNGTVSHALTVLPCASGKIAGDTNVKRAIRPVRHDVDPSTHSMDFARTDRDRNEGMDARVKPGHDGWRSPVQVATTEKPSTLLRVGSHRWSNVESDPAPAKRRRPVPAPCIPGA